MNKKQKVEDDDKESFFNVPSMHLQLEFDRIIVRIPKMIWKLIFSFLDSHSIFSLRCVCKTFHNLCEEKQIWKKIVERNEKDLLTALEKLDPKRKNVFKDFLRSNCKNIFSKKKFFIHF